MNHRLWLILSNIGGLMLKGPSRWMKVGYDLRLQAWSTRFETRCEVLQITTPHAARRAIAFIGKWREYFKTKG